MDNNIGIIGTGFSSLAAACYLAQSGFKVEIFEKNQQPGGRARQWNHQGFTFDMGPTWYWMPDVFERFFSDFNRVPADYYNLIKLNPAYEVYYGIADSIKIGDNLEAIYDLFEKEEPGSSQHLKGFLKKAKCNYEVAIENLVYKPGESVFELITPDTIKNISQFFGNVRNTIRKEIRNPRLIQLLEFPVLFLGAKPGVTPSFYNFMNYADFGLGTWHPEGGMHRVVEAMIDLATELGVKIHTNATVNEIKVINKQAKGLMINGEWFPFDYILSGADYHHSERLIPEEFRSYSEKYWEKKVFAPSALIFYVGLGRKINNVSHHTLFFDTSFDQHASSIYDHPSWPEKPLFYASFPSITDASLAPKGMESATFLIPVAPGLNDTTENREAYFLKIIDRFEQLTGQQITNDILFRRSFSINDFRSDYNAYKGNAYGLANTLAQTAFLRPKIKSHKINNLYFTGQLTVPGPGVPPSLISGKIAAKMMLKQMLTYEKFI